MHLGCAEGDIPTPLSIVPKLVLAKAFPFVLFFLTRNMPSVPTIRTFLLAARCAWDVFPPDLPRPPLHHAALPLKVSLREASPSFQARPARHYSICCYFTLHSSGIMCSDSEAQLPEFQPCFVCLLTLGHNGGCFQSPCFSTLIHKLMVKRTAHWVGLPYRFVPRTSQSNADKVHRMKSSTNSVLCLLPSSSWHSLAAEVSLLYT